MDSKLKKTLFLLSSNSRITTKELSKNIRKTQQTASYIINQLRKKKIIKESNTIVDPIKLGYTNVLVGLNLLVFDYKSKRELISELKKIDSIVAIEQGDQGLDLILEYCVSNLSAFNKLHTEIATKFSNILETKYIFPVVVKHRYSKAYLSSKPNTQNMILCGDRETRNLNEKEFSVLQELVKDPTITFTKLANKTNMSAKTAVDIKRRLEKRSLIRGYDCYFDIAKLKLERQIILLRLNTYGIGEIDKIQQYCYQEKNVIEMTKIIGHYQAYIIIEGKSSIELLNDLRSNFNIQEYLIVDISKMEKKRYVPENL